MNVTGHIVYSIPSGNGSCLHPGITESDTGESGEESELTYRNYETDVCFTLDEDEDDGPEGVSRNLGSNLQPNTMNGPGHISKTHGPDNVNDTNVGMTLLNVANNLNRRVSSDSDSCAESEMIKCQDQVNDDTTTSTSESEETQIWVPVSKRPSARPFQDATTASSNGSGDSRSQSCRSINKADSPGPSGSIACAGSYTWVSANHCNKSNSRAESVDDSTRQYSKDSWHNMQAANILSSGVQKRMTPSQNVSVGVLRHDEATGTIMLDIRNAPNEDSGLGHNEELYCPSEEPSTLVATGSTMLNTRPTRSQSTSVTESIGIMFSGMYMLFIVAAGLIIPVAEIFVTQPFPVIFEGFYIYLYVLSVAFLVYAYTFLVRLHTFPAKRRCGRTVVSTIAVQVRKRNVYEGRITEKPTGSFYFRLGAVGFGIASMIKSGLQFGEYFDMTSSSKCSHVLYGIRPIIHLCFTFFQLYFVFLNSKMLIQRYRHLARFGLMHMIATNLCVWFENVVKETLRDLRKVNIEKVSYNKTGSHITVNSQGAECHGNSLMGDVVDTSGPYLYPCSIIFSIICSSILFVMWLKLTERVKKLTTVQNKVTLAEKAHVDCSSSSKGLFLGIIIVVAVVIVLITFFVLVRTEEFINTAVRLDHLGEVVIFVITIIAAILAFHRMHCLRYEENGAGINFHDVLLIASVTGVYILCISNIIAGALEDVKQYGHLIIVSSSLRIIQGTLQTVFLLNTARRCVWKREQENNKPGRECVTFLLICNIALWGVNVFEVQRSKGIPLLEEFYGLVTWNIITHVSVPIAIFFRFHSTVCLANIWRHAWKLRK